MNVTGPRTGFRDDAFTREIVRNKLLALASEMGVVLARTSMSPIVYEVLDFACGICDVDRPGHRPGQRTLPLHWHLQAPGRVDPGEMARRRDATWRRLHDQLTLRRRHPQRRYRVDQPDFCRRDR